MPTTTRSKTHNKISWNSNRTIFFSLHFANNLDSCTEFGMDHISLYCKFSTPSAPTHLHGWHRSKFQKWNIETFIRSLFIFCRAILTHRNSRIKPGVLLSTVTLRFKIGHPIKSQDLWPFCEFMLMSSWDFYFENIVHVYMLTAKQWSIDMDEIVIRYNYWEPINLCLWIEIKRTWQSDSHPIQIVHNIPISNKLLDPLYMHRMSPRKLHTLLHYIDFIGWCLVYISCIMCVSI